MTSNRSLGRFYWMTALLLVACAPSLDKGRKLEKGVGAHDSAAQAPVASVAAWRSVAASETTVLAVRRDGSLWVWGWDQRGGDLTLDRELRVERNRPPRALPPTRVGHASDWASVSAAERSMYALKSDGSLWSWPENRDEAALQDGGQSTGDDAAFPEPRRKGDETFSQVAAGGRHDIVIKSDGTLIGWGDNTLGAIGDGAIDRSVVVQMTNHRWLAVATSWCQSAGIQIDHSLWTWGHCTWPSPLPERAQVPKRIDPGSDWQQVALASEALLALKADGSLWTLPASGASRDRSDATKPAALERIGQANDWSQISAHGDILLALKRDGSLWAWGKYFCEFTEDLKTKCPEKPERMGDAAWRSAWAGNKHIVAERLDGTTWTWGDNQYGQLGDNRILATLAPMRLQPGTRWRFVGGTLTGPVGVRDDNSVWEFGHRLRDCGVKKTEWTTLALQGGSTLFGVQPDGSLWEITCHKGASYKLPNQPFAESPSQRRWVRLSGTQFGLLALDDQDNIWEFKGAWNDREKRYAWSPVGPIGSRGVWTAAFAKVTENVALAAKKDGTLWMLDSGSEERVHLDAKSAWESFAAGEADIVGLDSKGRIWRFDPDGARPIGQRSEWKQVSVGQRHSVAVKKDGTLWSWGEGQAGELGTVWAGTQPSPVRVGTDNDWVHAVAGNRYTVALKKDGSLWGWGSNLNGEIGVGSPLRRELPAKLEAP
jgi:alpha-tubulin suppressor-like RCC1 family protein